MMHLVDGLLLTQPNVTICQRKISNKVITEISNHLGARLVLLLSMADWLTLSQMPSTMFPKMLQYSTVGKRSNYVARTCLPLITLWDIQLNIQMTQKHRGQW